MSDIDLHVLHQLTQTGWVHLSAEDVAGMVRSDDLVAMASKLGTPVRQASAPMVQSITPQPRELARANTMSAICGLEAFPPHTDAAHWPMPPRYVLLQCQENVSAIPTMLADAAPLLADERRAADLERALWRVKRVLHPFLCSAVFSVPGGRALRWDPCAMIPATQDSYANDCVTAELESLCETNFVMVKRSEGDILVIDNWRTLHWRPSVPHGHGPRKLNRILVA